MEGKKIKPLDIIGIIKRYALIIIIIGTLSFLLLSPLAFFLNKLTYTAVGSIKIEPVTATTLVGFESSITSYYKDFVGTQIFKIHSKEIVEKALERLSEEDKKVFIKGQLPYEKEIEIILRSFTVTSIRDTHLINVIFTWETNKALADLINEIMLVYLEEVEKEIENKDRKRLDYLLSEKLRLEKELEKEFELLKEVSDMANTSTFSEQFNPHNNKIDYLNEAYIKAYSGRLDAENRYIQVKDEVDSIKELSLDSLVDEMVEKDQSLWDLGFWTYKTLQEMNATLDGMTIDNSDRIYVEERMTNMQNHLEKLRGDVRKRAEKVIYTKRDYELSVKEIEASASYKASVRTENQLWQDLIWERELAAEVSKLILKGAQIEENIKNLRQTYDRVTERLYYLQAESMAPSRLSLATKAQFPFEPSGATKTKLLALIFILAYGWISFVILVIVLTDNRIRSTKDVENALGFEVNWPISKVDFDFLTLTTKEKGNYVYEAINSVAIKIHKEYKKQSSKIITFTGTDKEIGTTSILLNIGTIISNLGVKVCIVEGKNYNRFYREYYNKDSELINDNERNVDIVSLEYNLIENHHIDELLEKIKKDYDMVIFDTDPILKSGLTEYIILQSDLTMVICHGDYSYYRDLRKSFEILEKLEVESVGAILNWGSNKIKKRRR